MRYSFCTKLKIVAFASAVLGISITLFKLTHHVQEHNDDLKNILDELVIIKEHAKRNGSSKWRKPTYRLLYDSFKSSCVVHIRKMFDLVGYEERDDSGTDVIWTINYPFNRVKDAVDVSKLRPMQKVNHFPGIGYLTSKVILAKFKFRYSPKTFLLPEEKNEFLAYTKENPQLMWVQKNLNHRGVHLSSSAVLSGNDSSFRLVQRFIDPPFLIGGHKFDIGIYVILTSVAPLRAYVYDGDWLLRFCPEKYYPFQAGNERRYVVANDYLPIWEISAFQQWTALGLSYKQTLFAYLDSVDIDTQSLEAKLYRVVAELVESQQDKLLSAQRFYNINHDNENFFELFRVDLMLNELLEVFLLEVNMSPNFSSEYHPRNGLLYERAIWNTIHLVGLSAADPQLHRQIQHHVDDVELDGNIQLYGRRCENCTVCSAYQICGLCGACMTEKNLSLKTNSSVKFGKYDHLLALWYQAKCEQDPSLC